ncbi:YHYH protein [Oligoflexaceae bacterium]|nr:YHYH protein [Oligoflexaceae bacterium]
MMKFSTSAFALIIFLVALVSACESDSGDTSTGSECEPAGECMDPALFEEGSLESPITVVDCTLVDGTKTSCYKVAIAGLPTNHETGPYCPTTVDDGPEAGGKWPTKDGFSDVDGAFIMNLPEFYGDDGWDMWDPVTRLVKRVESAEDCEGAAAGGSGELGYTNICIDCSVDALGGPVVNVNLIPVKPKMAEQITELEFVSPGVALNGVRIAFPAGLDAILASYQIAALDDCGGHTNNADGYHYHESAGCALEVEQSDGHAPLIGYARDGYGIYAMTNSEGVEPADLDECRGHTDAIRGFHYHAASAGENAFIGCFRGVLVEDGDDLSSGVPGTGGGAPPGGGGGPGGPPE